MQHIPTWKAEKMRKRKLILKAKKKEIRTKLLIGFICRLLKNQVINITLRKKRRKISVILNPLGNFPQLDSYKKRTLYCECLSASILFDHTIVYNLNVVLLRYEVVPYHTYQPKIIISFTYQRY